MARVKNPNREKAFQIYKDRQGKIKPKELAEMLGEKDSNIRNWKSLDKWDENIGINKRPVGAPKGNKNAVGNQGGAPIGNQNNRKHGFLSKYMPKSVYNAFEDIENMDTLEILWTNIKVKFANILRAQKLMYVKSSKDHAKLLKKETSGDVRSKEYEVQFAWDRHEKFMKAESVAMRDLSKMIKDYEELLHKSWDLCTEEQKLRIERLKGQVAYLKKDDLEDTDINIIVDYGDKDENS